MLELSGPRPSWRGAAFDGWLNAVSGDSMRVLALLGPEGATSESIDRAQRAASVALTLRHPGVLRLIHLLEYGDRAAWCYEPIHGIGLIHLVGSDGVAELPARAAAELVAQVAETLLGLGSTGLLHPGPEPADLVLGANGKVQIAGFSGPYPASPAMRAPDGSNGEAAAVYRLGVLLAHLTSGSAPPSGSDPAAHMVVVRRALIRAMERPGPALSDRYGQWMRGLLAWAAAERPPLSSVPAGLRAVAWATGGEGLGDWAARCVPGLVSAIEERSAASLGPSATPAGSEIRDNVLLSAPPARATSPGLRLSTSDEYSPTLPSDDDRTQEETLRPDELSEGRRPSRPRPDAVMPVDIGPPPQAISRKPTLPAGFLDRPEVSRGADLFDTAPVEVTQLEGGSPAILIGVIIGLLVLVLVLSAYVLFGERGQPLSAAPDGPSLNDAVAPIEALPVAEPAVQPAYEARSAEAATGSGTGAAGDADPAEAEEPTPPAPRPEPAIGEPGGPAAPSPGPSRASPAEDRAAVAGPPAAGVLALNDGPHVVRFRLAPELSGALRVSCDGMGSSISGPGEVLIKGLGDAAACVVRARSPAGATLEHQVRIERSATIDCFHDAQPGCLD